MDIKCKHGTKNDLKELKDLAIHSWGQFREQLTIQNWQKLFDSLTND